MERGRPIDTVGGSSFEHEVTKLNCEKKTTKGDGLSNIVTVRLAVGVAYEKRRGTKRMDVKCVDIVG